MNKQPISLIFKLHVGMGIYGFTRGYRSYNKSNTRENLIGEKLFNGALNGYMYCIPIYNFRWIYSSVNRLEVKYRNLDKNIYEENYKEMTGICDDII